MSKGTNACAVTTSPSELPYLTGMRGYAASAVLLAHVTGRFSPSLPEKVWHLLWLGPNGVYVFFVLSAFTITLSLQRGFNPLEYAIKRFFRIAPAYYVVLLVMLPLGGSYWAEHFDTPYDFRSFLHHLTFLNWQDYTQTNNAIGVEWTLSIEILYYAFIPAMVVISRSLLGCMALLVIGAFILYATSHGTPPEAYKWAPWPYFICFASGVVTFRIWQTAGPLPDLAKGAMTALVVMTILTMNPAVDFEGNLIWWTGGACLLIFVGNSTVGKKMFENPFALYLGRLSYSLYLVHLPIASLLSNVITGWAGTTATILCSVVAAEYLHGRVEVVGRQIGRYAVEHLPRRYSARVCVSYRGTEERQG